MYLQLVLSLAILSLAGILLGWTDVPHLCGGALLLGLLYLIVLRTTRRPRGSLDDEIGDIPPSSAIGHVPLRRRMVKGVLNGVLAAGYLAVCFFACEKVGQVSGLLRHEKSGIERDLAVLEGAGHFEDAARLLEQALRRPDSREVSEALGRRLYDDLVRAAEAPQELSDRIQLLDRAANVAEAHGLDAVVARTLLDSARGDQGLIQEIEQYRKQKLWPLMTARLQSALRAPRRADPSLPLEAWLHEALIEWGKTQPTAQERLAKYRDALVVAETHGIPAGSTRALIQQTELESARPKSPAPVVETQAPVETPKPRAVIPVVATRAPEREVARRAALPSGTRAGLSGMTGGLESSVLLDVWVEPPGGSFLPVLSTGDFAVRLGGESAEIVTAIPVPQQTIPRNASIVLDVSGFATSISPRLKLSITDLMRNARGPGLTVRGLAFNEQVYAMCPWTSDVSLLARLMAPVGSSGHAGLHQALATAVAELRTRVGERHVLVFATGKDTARTGHTLDSVVAACRQDEITVHAVMIDGGEQDLPTLQRLTRETGGELIRTAPEGTIGTWPKFLDLSGRRAQYRLAVKPPSARPAAPAGRPTLQLDIGGTNGVTIRDDLAVPIVAGRQGMP